jgi:hypothetical protein
MAPTTSSPSSPKLVSFIHHRHALHYPKNSLQLKKYKSMDDIMVRVRYVVVEKYDYIKIMCEHCGSSVRPTMLTHDFNVIIFSTTTYLTLTIISPINLYFFSPQQLLQVVRHGG